MFVWPCLESTTFHRIHDRMRFLSSLLHRVLISSRRETDDTKSTRKLSGEKKRETFAFIMLPHERRSHERYCFHHLQFLIIRSLLWENCFHFVAVDKLFLWMDRGWISAFPSTSIQDGNFSIWKCDSVHQPVCLLEIECARWQNCLDEFFTSWSISTRQWIQNFYPNTKRRRGSHLMDADSERDH